MVCGLLYRPPSVNASLLANVESALEQLSPSRLKSLVLLGDFNIDRSPTSSHPLLHILNSIEDKLDLQQVVTTATRTTPTSSTIIDHIYVSNGLSHSHCTDLPPLPGSDHNILQPPAACPAAGKSGCTSKLISTQPTQHSNAYQQLCSLWRV